MNDMHMQEYRLLKLAVHDEHLHKKMLAGGNYVTISGHPSCHSAHAAKICSDVLTSFEMRVNDQRECSSAASATQWVG
jgi:hypothetical protein